MNNEYRCEKCNKLLFIGKFDGTIKITCPSRSCKHENLFEKSRPYDERVIDLKDELGILEAIIY